MSLLFPDHIRIGLGASYAVLARVNGARVTAWQMQTWDAAATASPWQRGYDTIVGWMGEMSSSGIRVSVALSAELAPLYLLPWRDDATRPDQQALLAAAHFRSIHGEVASRWETSAAPCGFGQPWLASATDTELILSLTEQLQARGARLASVQPLAVSLFNALRQHTAGSACWLLVPEPKKLTAIHMRAGQWCLLQTLPMSAIRHEPLSDLLSRETRLAGLPGETASMYLASTVNNDTAFGGCRILDPGWKITAAVSANSPLHLIGGGA